MSIINDQTQNGKYIKDSAKIMTVSKSDIANKKATLTTLMYTPEETKTRESLLKDFRNGWQTMHLPRPEFNDLSLYQRHIVDMLAFNTYQENDGHAMMEDRLGGWKSTEIRPIVRNKAISIAAHETARTIVPKIFAYNNQNDEQEDSAKVMGYLIDWAREQANYPHIALYRVLQSLYSPISWGYTEYSEVYKRVQDGHNNDGTVKYTEMIDEDESGFKHLPIPTDQVFFANFYERDEQKQDFILMRRIISYDKAKMKYPESQYPNMCYVKGGIVVTMSDANDGYYQVYDPHMRSEDVEEVIRWRKSTDSRDIMVNGVLISGAWAPNPRMDHQYPFDAFYYLPINERCIAGKSLVAAITPEATLINRQYQMINDGFTLNLYPPTVTSGSDKAGMDVMVPGLNLAFADKDVKVNPLRTVNDQSLMTAMNISKDVEASINASSQDPVQQGQNPTGNPSTAYEISRIEQNAATVLGLSMKFIAQHAIKYGKLLLSDVLQYLTVADAEQITESEGLLYKTFFVKEPGTSGKVNKIQFDGNLPDTMTDDEKMDISWALLLQQGGIKGSTNLIKVNPVLFREYKYKFTIDSDVMNPRSQDLMRAYDLETYDRAINNPVADQEKLFTDLLMATNPKTSRDPKAYVKQEEPLPPPIAPMMANGGSAPAPLGQASAPKPANQAGKLPQNI